MSTVLYVFLALLLLGIMVMVHELGHFTAARLCGIAVRSFGIGFGPRLVSWTGRHTGTEYTLRIIPGGGYCGFYGEDDAKGDAASDPRSITLQPAWKRLITLFAGPFMNFVLAFAVALVFFSAYGLPYAGDVLTTRISSVQDGSPADQGGLRAGDEIVSADGVPVSDNLVGIIASWDGKAPLQLEVRRGKEQLSVAVTPDFIASEGRYMIGAVLIVESETIWRHAPFGTVLSHTWTVCVEAGGMILVALKNLVTKGEGLDQMSGPVGVINIIAQQTRIYRLMGYLNVLIMISINLGLVNLLPIPGLDGCRILFIIYEMIFRRPVNRRIEACIHLAGYAFLIAVMLYFTFHDVINIFG